MPPRRRSSAAAQERGLEFLEDVVEGAVDTAFDRIGDAWENFREKQRSAVSQEQLRQSFTCAGCRNGVTIAEVEMVHPTNGFALCKKCFAFLWEAGKEKMRAFGRNAARQAATKGAPSSHGAPSPPPPSGEPPPWEVLGVAQDATTAQVKKAYRKQAMLWHPDRVPANAGSDERLKAKAMFDRVQRAYQVMMKVRSAPEGP